MTASEKIFLNHDGVLVTDHKLMVGDIVHSLREVSAVRVVSASASGRKAVPFGFAVACVVWAVSEIVNAPADLWIAGFAIGLALLSAGMVSMVGGFQRHTVFLDTAQGESAVFESRDGRSVSAMVKSIRQVLAERAAQAADAWSPGMPAHI